MSSPATNPLPQAVARVYGGELRFEATQTIVYVGATLKPEPWPDALRRVAFDAWLARIALALGLQPATLAALPDLLFELNADGTFAEFAAGPTHLMAAPPETLRGKHMSEMLPPNTFAIAQHALETTMKTGRVDGVRYRLDLPDGPHWFELTGALKPADPPATEPTIIFLVRDVTADTRIREEVSRLGKIVETMPNLVCIIDIEGRIVWCNTAFEQQIGWSLADIRGKDLAGLVRVPGWLA